MKKILIGIVALIAVFFGAFYMKVVVDDYKFVSISVTGISGISLSKFDFAKY